MAAQVPRYALCRLCGRFEDMNSWVTRYEFCPECGTKFVLECPDCKKPLVREGNYCTHCGERLYRK
jgi:NADH pyrophosphatase NudC (nudix superfamily)